MNDICITIFRQHLWQPFFLSFYWTKTIERERRREKIKRQWQYERKSCHKIVKKIVVQISFLFKKTKHVMNSNFGIPDSNLDCLKSNFYMCLSIKEEQYSQ